MIVNGKRALAYIVQVDEVKPLDGYDRVEYARTNGWWCIIGKDEMKPGDKAVYFEVDSLVPSDDERFAFMEKRKYKVKTQRMCKVLSQGLLMGIDKFPEFKNYKVGDDVTEKLGVKYYVAEDNERKSNGDPMAKYKSMAARHRKIANKFWFKKLMKYKLGRKILFFLFGKKKDNPRGWPTHLVGLQKSDQERVQNMPWILNDKNAFVETTKIDGTSSTYVLERKPFGKFEYYVLSRNVRQADRNQGNWHSEEENVYWDVSDDYKIKDFLHNLLENNSDWKWVALQGETAGISHKGVAIQGNPHKFDSLRFFGFDMYNSQVGKMDIFDASALCEDFGIPWVPITSTNFILPDTVEELLVHADGPCEAEGASGLREGYVYHKVGQTNLSFKAVSNKYLLKH